MPVTHEEAKCPTCGKPFRQLVIKVLGQEAFRAKVCEDCLPKDDEADRLIAAREEGA